MAIVAGSAATAADITQAVAASGNFLINGGFDFAQRQAPGTYTTIATDKYSADGWRVSSASASLQYLRQDVSGVTGVNTKYCGTFKQITNSGKFCIIQPIEHVDSVHLRGKVCTWQIKGSSSAAATVRMAILQGSATGTADVIPTTLVTAWGGVGTDPTWGAQIAIIGTATSLSVGTAFTQLNITGTIPADSKNVIAAIWTNALAAANWTLSLTEANLHPGAEVRPWIPRPYVLEKLLVQRQYQKSYPIDTSPGVAVSGHFRVPFIAVNTDYAIGAFPFPVEMRSAPVVTIYSQSGTSAAANEFLVGTQVASIGSVFSGVSGIYAIQKTSALVEGKGYTFNYVAESSL